MNNQYRCTTCDWMAGDIYNDIYLEDCYYKFIGEEMKVISQDDINESKLEKPDDYYPKMTAPISYSNMDGSGYDWLETWLCPYCKKEFSFTNGT